MIVFYPQVSMCHNVHQHRDVQQNYFKLIFISLYQNRKRKEYASIGGFIKINFDRLLNSVKLEDI